MSGAEAQSSGADHSSKHIAGMRKETYNSLLGLGDTLGVNQHGLLGQSTPVITDPLGTEGLSGFDI